MKYAHVVPARFIHRPNRFIAEVLIDGKQEICHVKNTGRCKELLTPGSTVYLQECPSPARKTRWDLIAAQKGSRLINMDAAAPNKVFGEWVLAGGLGFVPDLLRPERAFGSSRLDFYLEHGKRKIFAEIKGVTLEDEGIVRFPDAPTERGVKHLRELCRCVEAGYEALAVFIIQMCGVKYFEVNRATHAAFAEALADAAAAGVCIMAMDCAVTPDSITIRQPVEVRL
ncbi:MAG: DNA/RNA nuclease SfsA [Firmicutes bacterium]|nr:DNA/RNA nuclease SfsA [Bacillota bacterium]